MSTKLSWATCSLQQLDSFEHGGRPVINIPFHAIERYLLHGIKVREIAEMFGVCRQTIHWRMNENGLRKSDMYSQLTEAELDAIVAEIQQSHPNTGYRMMKSFLQAKGMLVQITRVRDSLRRVDPIGTEVRAVANRTLRRRQYSVPAQNAMWHIDGNHKLIRIERLWRDVYIQVLEPFHILFCNLEREGMLNPDDESHLFALHWAFLPQLRKQLAFFMDAWNLHGLRTAGSKSPYQLWASIRHHDDPDQVEADYGIDWDGPYGFDDLEHQAGQVEVPQVQLQRHLTEDNMADLPDPNVPFMDALDIYTATLQQLMQPQPELDEAKFETLKFDLRGTPRGG
uniref:Integrase core domain-containing protein n=1 Tax=Oryzias latipes TaxID=8090 RepID=A0A3P9HXU2_ORYLA